MLNSKKFLNRLFRRVEGVVWDPMVGTTGLQTVNGVYTVAFDEEGEATLSVNPLESLSMALPAFATQTPHDKVQRGDIIVGDQGIIGWVTKKHPVGFEVLDHNGHTKKYNPPKVAIFGGQGPLVVRNLMSMFNVDNSSDLAPSLLPLLMMADSGSSSLEDILPFLLMSSQGGSVGGAGGINPMMLMMMSKKGGLSGSSKMDPMMMAMMMGGMGGSGGAGGINPMMLMMMMKEEDSTPVGLPAAKGIPALNRL